MDRLRSFFLDRISPLLIDQARLPRQMLLKGHNAVIEPNAEPELVVIATGSEVPLAVAVAKAFGDKKVRVVSMPCTRRISCSR